MGDLETLAKARRELQDLYLGVPDDSVNLSFQELAQVTQRKSAAFSSQLSLQKKSPPAAAETSSKLDKPPSLAKLPSLDFSRALEASSTHRNHNRDSSNITHHFDHPLRNDPMPLHHHHHHNPDHHPQYAHAMNGHAAGHRSSQYGHTGEAHWDDHHGLNGHENHQIHNQQHHVINGHADHHHQIHSHQHHHHASPYGIGASHHTAADRSMGYLDDDMSHMSGMTMAATPNQARRRRPGIPHSNICTVCSTYIYIFRYRCLVCGRVYCRQCVRVGMGDMAEGRKCVECLGRRFSHRYIQRAGQMGCCMGYANTVRQQELKWAEKGPRRSGENRSGRSGMVSSSRNPVVLATTPSRVVHTPNTPPSFVMNSPRSPYTPTRHHLPF